MNYETLQQLCQITIFIGAFLVALAGYGTYHYGKQIEKEKEAKQAEDRHREEDNKKQKPQLRNITAIGNGQDGVRISGDVDVNGIYSANNGGAGVLIDIPQTIPSSNSSKSFREPKE